MSTNTEARSPVRRTRVAVAQMCSGPDLAQNLAKVRELAARAQEERAELLVFPECFAYLGPERGKLDVAESLSEGGPVLACVREVAASTNMELVLGGFWEKSPDPNKVFNSCVVVAPSGDVRAVYRKIHLFDVDLADGTTLRESASVAAGSEIVTVDEPFGTLGLSICYDLRFPELYRALTDRGATAVCVPSAFTLTTGKDHWHVLLRARAIESQCYVFAAAQVGVHFGTRASYGHALICDPWGVVVAEHGEGEGIVVANVDPEVVARVRRQLPSLRHRVLGNGSR